MYKLALIVVIIFTVSCQRITTDVGGGGEQKAEVQYDEKQSNPHPNNPGN